MLSTTAGRPGMLVKILICDMCSASGMPDCDRQTMSDYGWLTVGQRSEMDLCPRCLRSPKVVSAQAVTFS